MASLASFRPAAPAPPLGPVGYRGPRGAILLHLKREGCATARALAEQLGSSLNAVRHHLKELEAEGVISYVREPKGVGAPAYTYRLSTAGHALFPDRYARTVEELLDHLVATAGREAAVTLLATQYRNLAARLDAECAGASTARRGEVIARVLEGEGYMATWRPAEDGGVLTEHNCPHRVVAERFPEVCAAEEAFLTQAFGRPVARRSRIAGGCGTCSYHVAGSAAENEETR